jgi:hypothetical protein
MKARNTMKTEQSQWGMGGGKIVVSTGRKAYNIRVPTDFAWSFDHECERQHMEPMNVLRGMMKAFIEASKSCAKNPHRKVKAQPFVLKCVEEKEVDN